MKITRDYAKIIVSTAEISEKSLLKRGKKVSKLKNFPTQFFENFAQFFWKFAQFSSKTSLSFPKLSSVFLKKCPKKTS